MALVPLSTDVAAFNGEFVEGAKLYAFEAGTTTPRALFLSSALDPTRIHPVPVLAADGCWPVMFTGVGDYDIRLTDADGAQIHFFANLPGDAAAAGGTGLDPLRQVPTGAVIRFYGTGRRAGYVRANGGTIGPGSADASERADDDCHDLYVSLYAADPNLVVAGGRSPSGAQADWEAGKTLALPNYQNRLQIAAGATYSLGAMGGGSTYALTLDNLPPHGHAASFAGTPVPNHNHFPTAANQSQRHTHSLPVSQFTILQGTATAVQFFAVPATGVGSQGTPTSTDNPEHTHAITENDAGGHTPSGTVTITATGFGTPFSTLPPYVADTVYLKL